VFTARYALSPYIKQIRFVFKGLNNKFYVVSSSVVSMCLSVRRIKLWSHALQAEPCGCVVTFSALMILCSIFVEKFLYDGRGLCAFLQYLWNTVNNST
jgi:hypothetical protein